MVLIKIILTIIFCLFINNIKTNFEKKIYYSSIIVQNKEKFYLELNKLFCFILFFVLLFRIIRMFYIKHNYIDLIKVFEIITTYYSINDIYYFIIIIYSFIALKTILFLSIKNSFLRLHFYKLLSLEFYRKFLFIILNIKYFLYKKTNNNVYIIICFSFEHFFKLVVIIFFLKNLIFDHFVLNTVLLPYYGTYFFFQRIYSFFNKIETDFDQGILQCYYPEFFCVLEKGYLKLFSYKNHLLFNRTNFIFLNQILLFDFNSKFPSECLFFPSNNLELKYFFFYIKND